MTTNKKTVIYTCVVVPVAIANGILGGISSVITAYFFKPIWNKFMGWWNDERKTY